MEKTPEIQSIENKFKKTIKIFPQIVSYHDYRVIAESRERIIIVADIDVKEEVAESDFSQVANDLEVRVKEKVPNVAYCAFYITPKFAY